MKKTFQPTDRQVEVIAQLWAQKASVADIAKQFGTTSYSINYLCRTHRDKFPKRDITEAMKIQVRDCVRCGSPFESKWVRRKYCEPCSYQVQIENSEDSVTRRSETRNEAIDWIQSNRGKQKSSLSDVFDRPDMDWVVAYSVPYSKNASKNRRWRVNPGGSVYMLAEVRKYDQIVQAATARALHGIKVAQNKVWLSFYIEKPDHKSDAINIVDTICDAIKKAIGIDDRWFCIRQLDWCIKKSDQKIIISIGQESTEDVIPCSHCGEIKAPEYFGKNRGGPFGRSRACIECRRVLDRKARKNAA